MDKRYQVFISSTYADLKNERAKVIQTIMELDCIPAGMEIFPAIDEEQFEFIKKVIDDCDYYILIIGGRYGSISAEGISYTEMEYDYAITKNIKVIAFIHSNPDQIPMGKSEKNSDLRQKLQDFKLKVSTNRLIRFWTNAEELPGLVALNLPKTIKRYPAIGWIRANSTSNPEVYVELNEIRKENQELKSQITTNDNKLDIANLAEIEDLIEISGKHTYWNDQYHQDVNSNWSKKLTWGEIFALISPYLLKKPNDSKVKEKLSQVIYETIQNFVDSGISYIRDQDFQTIKIQFSALQLIELETTTDKSGQINLIWNTTEKGKNLMLNLRTIKK
ncbi:hypothetical protein FFWV33_15535 [Flavobacterium faecale]|uniref:DUF4062 domain-containing protein n=1 Tax=Flavobacterium faecale TaxID=1355330 RepID=A0A2S1LGK9_9FLAO|nr:DUF4062 domain-containing protein [Flavobacterium faecale]AWG22838.1 hypothetical protein FFWV33_15535 [Flavobacterium faecale]